MLFNLDDIQEAPDACEKAKGAKPESKKAREKRVRTQDALKFAIGEINDGESIHFVSGALWSTHDLVEYILQQIGPATITACSWSFSNPGIEKFARLCDKGLIVESYMLLDWRIHQRASEAATYMSANCTAFATTSIHAKVTVLTNDEYAVAIVGSANWTNNPRIEAGVLTADRKIAEFHKSWIMDEINKKDPLNLKREET